MTTTAPEPPRSHGQRTFIGIPRYETRPTVLATVAFDRRRKPVYKSPMSYVLVISRRRDFNDRRRYEADSAPKVRRHGVRKIGGFWLFGADFRDLGVFYLPARSTAQEMQYISFASGFM